MQIFSKKLLGNMAVPTLYTRPSLPSLLTEYGFHDKTQDSIKQGKAKEESKKIGQKKIAKKKPFDDTDSDFEAAKALERDEHYEQMVKNLYKLRDYYYNEYSSLLTDKVEQQRKDIKERDEILKREREKKEEEQKQASHQMRKRLDRHTLKSAPSTAFIPKTDLYLIVGLENKLRKQGALRTQTDYDKFRNDMHDPEIFQKHFNLQTFPDPPESQRSESEANNSSQDQNSDISSLPHDLDSEAKAEALRALSRISERHEASREASRPETQENWAVTQQYPAVNKNRRCSNVSQGNKSKAETHSELEKRFPKLEMPKLHCFTMNLAQKPPDPEEVRQQLELRHREKQRKKMLRTKTKMYQLAMANAATSNRIMDQHENFDLILNGPDLCDVIADHHWMEAYGLQIDETDQLTTDVTPVPALVQHVDEASSSNRTAEPARPTSNKSSAKLKRSTPAIVEAKPPLPLTMNEIEGNLKIMEAKSLSTMWNNYLRAGKNSMKSSEAD